MDTPRPRTDQTFVPVDACTLPTAEQPLRVAEFDALFADALVGVEQTSVDHLRLDLVGPGDLTSRARALTDRESACCSFFTFTHTPYRPGAGHASSASTGVHLDIEVPPARADVLVALAARAEAHLATAQGAQA